MPLMPEMSDERLTDVVTRFARLTSVVLRDPDRWLGWGDAEDDDPLLHRAAAAAGGLVLGRQTPGSPEWETLPAQQRADWWTTHIANIAGFVAATPRVAGAAADRLPIQAALSASVQGMAVCAVAREHGVDDPDAWVPLLGQVLFDRTLRRPDPRSTDAAVLLTDQDAVVQLTKKQPVTGESLAADPVDEPVDEPSTLRSARRTTWRLARTFLEVHGMFDERPRGAKVFRALGKLPVVGIVGGWLDERGGVRQAARETSELLMRQGSAKP